MLPHYSLENKARANIIHSQHLPTNSTKNYKLTRDFLIEQPELSIFSQTHLQITNANKQTHYSNFRSLSRLSKKCHKLTSFLPWAHKVSRCVKSRMSSRLSLINCPPIVSVVFLKLVTLQCAQNRWPKRWASRVNIQSWWANSNRAQMSSKSKH